MLKTKITYIISGVHNAPEFEWAHQYLSKNYDLDFILIGVDKKAPLCEYFNQHLVKYLIVPFRKKIQIPTATLSVILHLRKNKTDIVHCHLFEASLIGLTASYLTGVKKRMYTRHHSDLHHQYFPSAVKYDKVCNSFATHIIAVSKNVANILQKQEMVSSSKISIIHHGFNWKEFLKFDENILDNLRVKYNLNNYYPLVGVVSRFTHWKGIQYIIPAFSEILKTKPNAVLILANSQGDYKEELLELLKTIPEKNYRLINFESNMGALYQLFHVFVHAPINEYAEAFGQVYLESLASKVPSVFTLSGIASECIEDRKQALIVPYKNSSAIKTAIERLLLDEELRNTLKLEGFELAQMFSIENKMQAIVELYDKIDNHS